MNAPSISRNVASNLASNGVVALMSLLFVPVYIHVLGIEAYGLIGFFASIQVVFALLDLGLGAAANRELARLSVDPQAKDTARQFTRTLEVLYWLIAVILGLAMAMLAPTPGEAGNDESQHLHDGSPHFLGHLLRCAAILAFTSMPGNAVGDVSIYISW